MELDTIHRKKERIALVIPFYLYLYIDVALDILFSNMKHVFFQPCDNELIVLLHMHLHNPIMIGKRKVKDIQFYREASDASFDETGNRRRRPHYGDDDELQAEQEERRIRARLNKEFQDFADLISQQVSIRFCELFNLYIVC